MSPLPPALWVPSTGSHRIYRGSATNIVRQMAGGTPLPETTEALRKLVAALRSARGVAVALPWGQPDEAVAQAFLRALLDIGLGQPVPQA